ncbi:hypothetical protein HDU96_009694 [Phlyctochytrium bullatum]|nr:hypothetical protein HDU96_009694 [Phlyctochytrium bullatum]
MDSEEVILHFYHDSPFARKAIWALELKQIPYRTVIVKDVPVRAFSTTVLTEQASAHNLSTCGRVPPIMIDELEQRFPDRPSLVPSRVAGAGLLAETVACWTGKFLHPLLPPELLADRSKMQGGSPADVEAIKAARPRFREQVRAGLLHLEQALAESKTPWLLDQPYPTHVDIHAAMVPWFLYFIVITERRWLADTVPHVVRWIQALDRLTGGVKGTLLAKPMTEQESLEVAKSARGRIDTTQPPPALTDPQLQSTQNDKTRKPVFPEVKVGAAVRILPDDYAKIPVAGTVVRVVEGKSVAVRVEGMAEGLVTVVHFPIAGYVIKPVASSKL